MCMTASKRPRPTLFIWGVHNMKKLIFSGLMLLASAGVANADIITQWNFNSSTDDGNTATGSTNPSIGVGSASLVGGTTATFASGDASGGSTDPNVGDDSGWNITTWAPSGQENKGRGVQFSVSTLGKENISVSFDQRLSNTAANTWRFQYSLDGSTFIDGTQFTFTPAATGTGDVWYNGRTVDLSSVAGVANNASFAFRIVAEFDPTAGNYLAARSTSTYGVTGTSRFDMVTVNGFTAVPEPASMVLLGMVGVGGFAFRQFRRKANNNEVVAS